VYIFRKDAKRMIKGVQWDLEISLALIMAYQKSGLIFRLHKCC
jgi:hypothetical protein